MANDLVQQTNGKNLLLTGGTPIIMGPHSTGPSVVAAFAWYDGSTTGHTSFTYTFSTAGAQHGDKVIFVITWYAQGDAGGATPSAGCARSFGPYGTTGNVTETAIDLRTATLDKNSTEASTLSQTFTNASFHNFSVACLMVHGFNGMDTAVNGNNNAAPNAVSPAAYALADLTTGHASTLVFAMTAMQVNTTPGPTGAWSSIPVDLTTLVNDVASPLGMWLGYKAVAANGGTFGSGKTVTYHGPDFMDTSEVTFSVY